MSLLFIALTYQGVSTLSRQNLEVRFTRIALEGDARRFSERPGARTESRWRALRAAINAGYPVIPNRSLIASTACRACPPFTWRYGSSRSRASKTSFCLESLQTQYGLDHSPTPFLDLWRV